MSCAICLISKRRCSLGKTIIKIKHKMNKMKWIVKFIQTRTLPPPLTHAHSFLSTTKDLGKIRLYMVFTLVLNKPKFNCFKKTSDLFHAHRFHRY